ncbi:hypothetical protein H3T52_07570 [Commensalibacter sp. M0402]|uniref:hypothetical protein n=1 Tax=Commensalibacter TaxID=1079922 RepID=UPI0018DC4760|nr:MULTISPECIES: hypothetical protein [Commensalibacter]MBI0083603.1 hypothetical protein [Commensalibacter sp. W6292M3]MBI0088802.1 hypothetical protein [Commensalibacter melissae]
MYDFLFGNNLDTILASDIDENATVIEILSGNEGFFPNIEKENQVFAITLSEGNNNQNTEICFVTSKNNNKFTVLRGRENTVSRKWPQGTTISNRITAEPLNQIKDKLNRSDLDWLSKDFMGQFYKKSGDQLTGAMETTGQKIFDNGKKSYLVGNDGVWSFRNADDKNIFTITNNGIQLGTQYSSFTGNIFNLINGAANFQFNGGMECNGTLIVKDNNIIINRGNRDYENGVLNLPSVIWQFNENNTMSIFATHDLNEGKKITIQSKINGVVYNAIVLRENGTIECKNINSSESVVSNNMISDNLSINNGTINNGILNINSTNNNMNENGLIVGNSSIHLNLVNRPGQTGGIYLQEDFNNNKTDLVFYANSSGEQQFYTMDSKGTITGKYFNGESMSAFCADLAEYYIADERYDPGTLVRIGGEKEITRASIGGFFYGVISTSPAYIMNTAIRDRKNALPVALAGRVPVLVTGMIDKGDPVTISEISGVARKAKSGERHIGFSLENSHETSIRPVECVIRQN